MTDFDFKNESYYEGIRREVERARSLNPETYRSREFFEAERKALWEQAWVCVGYATQVKEPGQALPVTVAGQPVIVCRDAKGTLGGYYNVCRHRGSLLVTEACKVERIRCPYHAWTYDLSGKLQNCPLFENSARGATAMPDFDREEFSLLPVHVATWGAFVFVSLSNNPMPITDYLGDLPDRYRNFPLDELVLVRRKEYSIRANWKLVAENFLEYYHLPWVHPELCRVTAIDMHQRNQGPGMYMSFFASPLLEGKTPLDAGFLPAMPGLSHEEAHSGYFPMIFPNVALFIMPHHMFSLLMDPTAPDHTRELGDVLVHPSVLQEPDVEKRLDEIFAFYDMVNVQDIDAVELVQRGVEARAYPGGRMTYRFEEPLHRFQNMVADYLLGRPTPPPGD